MFTRQFMPFTKEVCRAREPVDEVANSVSHQRRIGSHRERFVIVKPIGVRHCFRGFILTATLDRLARRAKSVVRPGAGRSQGGSL